MRTSLTIAAAFLAVATALAQELAFEDVVRNLKNPDPKIRASAARLLRESKYPEAIVPIAPLVTDPVDEVQIEAILTELSFFTTADVRPRRKIGFVVEVRNSSVAPAVFDAGPFAAWPRPVPPELVSGLLQATKDNDPRIRREAIYTLGVAARPPLDQAMLPLLLEALDSFDPEVRIGAALVAGRLNAQGASDALVHALNDSQLPVRFAAMRALGDLRAERAVQALTDQYTYYRKGTGAVTALEALARIGHPSSVALFKARRSDRDATIRRIAAEGIGRVGDKNDAADLEAAASTESSESVKAAIAFALHRLGRGDQLDRLVSWLSRPSMVPQVAGYLVEVGPSVAAPLRAHVKSAIPGVRLAVADVLGMVGGTADIQALESLKTDRDSDVALAATRAIERLRLAGGR